MQTLLLKLHITVPMWLLTNAVLLFNSPAATWTTSTRRQWFSSGAQLNCGPRHGLRPNTTRVIIRELILKKTRQNIITTGENQNQCDLTSVYTQYTNMSQKLPEESSVKAELTAVGVQGYEADSVPLFKKISGRIAPYWCVFCTQIIKLRCRCFLATI